MANTLNLERSNYTRLENRGTKLTLDQINSIADAIGVSSAELLGFDVTKTNNDEVKENEKDKEITELRKRVSELEKMNTLFEGNAYVIESISRRLINSVIEISYESAMYFDSEDVSISETDKSNNYRVANEKYDSESKKVLKDIVSQGSFLIVFKKMLLEQKDKLKIILEWILTDKLITENPSFGNDYNKTKKLVKTQIKAHSSEEIINEAMDVLFIPFFSGMGAGKQKLNGEND